jgi:SAM-dependent methyltransferase
MSEDYSHDVKNHILHESFVRAVFSGEQRGATVAYKRVIVRPVLIKEARRLQCEYFDDRKSITKNYTAEEAPTKLDELLDLGFKNIHVETTQGVLQVTFSKKNRPIVTQSGASAPKAVDLSHDRTKKRVLNPATSAPFLQAVGIMAQDGKIKADMQRKFKQINEFLRLFDEIDIKGMFGEQPIRVVDLGCGNAYLTFAAYHYLNDVLGLDAHITGVDIKAELLDQHREKARQLGWDKLTFYHGYIADYEPETNPDIVLALHACDTATDDALALGIRWGSKAIVSAPCCQHELQQQLCQLPAPNPFRAVMQDGILQERLGDILTDTFRASILRIMGYRTDVMQFVSSEHTAKNLMIRAVKTAQVGEAARIKEYLDLKAYWRVVPYLEPLLGEAFAEVIGAAEAVSAT